MKRFLGLVLCVFVVGFSCSYGQNVKTKSKMLQKQYKQMMKEIKETNQLKSVWVQVEDDGSWFFCIEGKGKTNGVADTTRKVLFLETCDYIKYHKEPDGYKYYELISWKNGRGVADSTGKVLLHSGYKDIKYCVASDGYCYFSLSLDYNKKNKSVYGNDIFRSDGIADMNGKIIVPTKYADVRYFPAGYNNGRSYEGFFLGENYFSSSFGFYAKDGTVKTEGKGNLDEKEGYWSVYNMSELSSGLLTYDGEIVIPLDCGIMLFEEEANSFLYRRKINGIEYYGAYSIDSSIPSVPCNFNFIMFDKTQMVWTVRLKEDDSLERYEPDKLYSNEYRDKGEEYYEGKEYDKVIDFYGKKDIEAPWGKFFTGMSLFKKANENILNANLLSSFIEKDDKANVSIYRKKNIDFSLIEQYYVTGSEMLNEYISMDTIYQRPAAGELQSYAYYLESMSKAQKRYEKNMKVLQQRDAEEAARLAAAQQRQAQITSILVGGLINAVVGGGNSSNSSSSGGNYSSSSSSSGAVGSSSSKSIDQSKLADWKARKSNAERLLINYREQLLKEPDSASLKHKIRSQEEIIKTCDERILEIQSGN